MPIPTPDQVGWVPASAMNGNFQDPEVPIPDWAAPYIQPEQWAQLVAEARAASQGDSSGATSPGMARVWNQWTPEQRFTSLLNQAAARALPQGVHSPYGGGETMKELLPYAVFGGAGVGSVLANLGAAGATGAGLSEIALPSSVAPTGAVVGGLGPSIPAGAGAAAVGPFASGGGLGGNFLERWLPHITTGVNALLGYSAADNAADAESEALQAAIEEQRRQYDTSRSDLMPWLTAGQGALGRLQDPNANFLASPDYAFRRSEGERDIGNSFAARGGAASGNALRALSEYNSSLASGEFGDWWNRQAGLAGIGQTTGTQLGQMGANSSANVGNYLAGQGASRASGVLGKYGSLAQGLNEGVSNYLYQRRRRP